MTGLPFDQIIALQGRAEQLRSALPSLSDQDRALSSTIARRMIAGEDAEETSGLRARRRETRDTIEDTYRALRVIDDQVRELQRTGDER